MRNSRSLALAAIGVLAVSALIGWSMPSLGEFMAMKVSHE